ncbi:MAG: DUF262 domain-containing HNH endonuclease family protein [Halobacteriota archaeon]
MASTELKSIADIFERKVFRIPDYQRGYAWEDKQLNDFWEDLENLNLAKDRYHYTGVITLERVEDKIFKRWDEDKWLIEDGDFTPYFIVDGQQRLITTVILIQTIIEKTDNDYFASFEKSDLIKKYIYQKKRDGISKTYIFGYDKDNPSYEFLKTKIFNEKSITDRNIETLYTANLEYAKGFFQEKIKEKNTDELAKLFKKITQKLKFNVYEIEKDLDVFIAFETMNNRGKQLSNLELLKNRLIYLSTIFDKDDNDKDLLRKHINESWKTIYEYLGKNKNNPLDDDEFLKNHWVMYFGHYSRKTAADYIKFLLDEHFTVKNVLNGRLKIKDIEDYVINIQKSIQGWFILFNPETSKYEDNIKKWLYKLSRIGYGSFRPIIMAILVKNKEETAKIVEALKVMERCIFLIFRISQRRSNTGDSEFYGFAKDYHENNRNLDVVVTRINEKWIQQYFDIKKFKDYMDDKFTLYDKDGFYGWWAVKYFLYEYDLCLQEKSKTNKIKINWEEFKETKKDYISVEHIYPQTSGEECWNKYFGKYSEEEKNFLCNSLGNLLPLSKQKNSSLQNDCFEDKKKKKNGSIGYFNGSYSENEVAQKETWGPKDILERGLELLNFLEERWDVNIGEEKDKIELLHLNFINE